MVILLGNGNGTFATGVYYDTAYSNSFITTADLNADGKLDLITGGYYVSTLLGNGDGTFQGASTYYSDSYRVAVADFNGDGRADLVYSSYGGVKIRLGGCSDLAIAKTHSGNFTGYGT
jgi:Tfp pilus tip-associated adhesin PilY1